jgi:quercetin dioxygenase-like cupin family protein
MPDEDVAALRDVSREEMMSRIVAADARDFRPAFIDQSLPTGGAQIAPVIGLGMTQNREHAAPITNAHEFSAEWLRIEPGQSVGPFMLDEKMVLMMHEGQLQLDYTEDGVSVQVNAWDTYSVPAGVMRTLTATGDTAVEVLVVLSGDHRKRPVFAPEVLAAAMKAGLGLDASGFVAKAHLLPSYGRAS